MRPVPVSRNGMSTFRHRVAQDVRSGIDHGEAARSGLARRGASGPRRQPDARYSRRARRGSGVLGVLMHVLGLVGGGAVGLVAGYALLTWLGGAQFNVFDLPLPWVQGPGHPAATPPADNPPEKPRFN